MQLGYAMVMNRYAKKGLVIIYTGNGKGKTTAALGLALRAAGYGKRVKILQFMKQWKTGELTAIKKFLPNVEISQWGKGWVKIMGDKKPFADHQAAAKAALQAAQKLVQKRGVDVVILDELLSGLAGNLLSEDDVLALIAAKRPALDLVITGHKLTPKIKAAADLVTEMRKLKHPYDKGILAKKGIDF